MTVLDPRTMGILSPTEGRQTRIDQRVSSLERNRSGASLSIIGGGGSVADATTSVKGKIKLGGDFASTATADTPVIDKAAGHFKVKGHRPWIDVTHPTYGADPTGVTTATAAIQAAIDAANTLWLATGEQVTVRLHPGIYKCATTPVLKSGVHLLGYGAIIKADAALAGTSALLAVNDFSDGTDVFAQSEVTLEGLTFDGNKANRTTVTSATREFLLKLYSIEKLRVINCVFTGHKFGLLALGGCKDVELRGLRFRDWGDPGSTALLNSTMTSTTPTAPTGIEIQGGTAAFNTNGFAIIGTEKIRWTGKSATHLGTTTLLRGQEGTTAAAHSIGDTVTAVPVEGGPALWLSGNLVGGDLTPTSRVKANGLDFQGAEWTSIYCFCRDSTLTNITSRDTKEGAIYTQGLDHLGAGLVPVNETTQNVEITNFVATGVRRKHVQGCGFEGGGHNLSVQHFTISDTDGPGVQVNWPAENVKIENGRVFDTVKQQATYTTFTNYGQVNLLSAASTTTPTYWFQTGTVIRNVTVTKSSAVAATALYGIRVRAAGSASENYIALRIHGNHVPDGYTTAPYDFNGNALSSSDLVSQFDANTDGVRGYVATATRTAANVEVAGHFRASPGGVIGIGSLTDHPVVFRENNTESFRILATSQDVQFASGKRLGFNQTPAALLHFASSTASTDGIRFGTDASPMNLYRSAANAAQFDNTDLQLGGKLTPTGGVAPVIAPTTSGRISDENTPVTSGTDKTPVANTLYLVQVRVPFNTTLTGVALNMGGTVGTDNVLVSLYNASGTRVAVGTSTLASGANTMVDLPFTGTYAAPGPGLYFVGVQISGTTAKFRVWPASNSYHPLTGAQAQGSFAAPASLTPPSTYTADQGPIIYLY